MNLATIISLALTYGPAVMRLAHQYGPLVVQLAHAVQPIVQRAIEDGALHDLPHIDQVNEVLTRIGHAPMSDEEAAEAERRWMERASGR